MAVGQFLDSTGVDGQSAREQQPQQPSPFAPRSNVSSSSATPTKRKVAAAAS